MTVFVAVLLVFVRRCLVVALDIKVDRLEGRVVLRCGVVWRAVLCEEILEIYMLQQRRRRQKWL